MALDYVLLSRSSRAGNFTYGSCIAYNEQDGGGVVECGIKASFSVHAPN